MRRDLQPQGKDQPRSQNQSRLSGKSQGSIPQRVIQSLPLRERLAPVASALIQGRQKLGPVGFGHLFMGTWALIGAIATTLDIGLVELLERQTQTAFFQLRGAVEPPSEVVILAIDEQSLDQGEIYTATPDAYPYLEPLQAWPWQRQAYAIAIDRLMQAGARTVSLDLIFDTPSSWGMADDQELKRVLQKYEGRVAIAASYEDQRIQGQGTVTQLIKPLPFFLTEAARAGSINFWIDWDGRIHRLSREFPILLAQQYPDLVDPFQEFGKMLPSFEQATLRAAQIPEAEPRGSDIFFYGPLETFTQFSFWQVLDPETWDKHVQEQTFKDKIVLVGPTATLFQDMHATPFGKMSGVEVHANAIATLLENRAIAQALPNSYWRGVLVFISSLALGTLISRPQQPSARFRRTLLFLILWGVLGGGLFVGALLIIPTAVPMATIGLGGLSYVVTSLAGENLRKLKLRSTLKQYASSPIIQEIISQQDDLRDLLEEREREALGKLLGGRYQIIEVLGSGGFGETYIAADIQRPGHPLCVAKRLRPISDDLKLLHLARRLFQREAETLERLGKHEQIPQLLAYFEEDQEFYLVQEFIDGHPLREELISNQKLPEKWVVGLLKELLKILEFIHEFGVIHRDIKPSNIIRRHSDHRLVIIDFGAVKEIHGGLIEDHSQVNTVGIGTRGYMPNEQCAGHPRFNSDIYAVGVIGIQALTGLSPERLQEDPRTGELIWTNGLNITPDLQTILTKMIRYDFSQRYQSVDAVLTDLENLPGLMDIPPVPFVRPVLSLPKQDDSQFPHIHIVYDDKDCADDPIAPTRLWGEESCSEEHSSDA